MKTNKKKAHKKDSKILTKLLTMKLFFIEIGKAKG